jgi:5'-3' exonuclease
MGIPGFFNLVSKKYNIFISKKLFFLDVFLDFNSIIYIAKNIVYKSLINYIKYKLDLGYDEYNFDLIPNKNILNNIIENEIINDKNRNIIYEIRDEMLYNEITKQCKKIIRTNITINTLHIYMDGVPMCSKLIEQRKRAIIGSLITYGKEIILEEYKTKMDEREYFIKKELEPLIDLDKNLIKPGTEFMIKLSNYLKTENKRILIDIIRINNPNFENFYFSGIDEKGEAEHKIMDILIKKNYKNILVYSPDADLIILLLPLTRDKNIYLIRESIKPEIYYINKLYSDIIKHIKNELNDNKLIDIINKKKFRIIKDICFIYNLFGNDFISKLDNINIYDNNVINILIKKYVILLNKKYNKKRFIINKKGNIIWTKYLQYLKLINEKFTHPQILKLYSNKPLDNNYINQIYSLDNFNYGLYKKNIDSYIWNSSFYNNKQFFDDSKNNIIKDYLLSIFMINILYSKIYYTKNKKKEKEIIFLWYYKHHKSPLLSDIIEYLENNIKKINKILLKHFKSSIKNNKITKIEPIRQLYYTIPLYQDFINITKSDINKYPKLKQHFIYEKYLNTLKWDNKKKLLNITDIIDCNLQRYLEKCVPLFKINNEYINLVFDLKYYF